MGGGNSCIHEGDNPRCDAGNDFKFDAVVLAVKGFFAATTKDIGVAPLEPEDFFSLQGLFHHQGVGLVLGQVVVVGGLAGIVDFFFIQVGGNEVGV